MVYFSWIMSLCVRRPASLTTQLYEICCGGDTFKQDFLWARKQCDTHPLRLLLGLDEFIGNVFFKNAKYIHQLSLKMLSLWFSVCKSVSRCISWKTELSICRINFMHGWARGITAWLTPVMMLASKHKLICACLLWPGTSSCCQPHWAAAMLPWLHGRGRFVQFQEVRGGR